MKGQEKYSTYLFEDFLQDDFFMESVKRPTEELHEFWNRFLVDYPEQSDSFHSARRFVEDLMRPKISDEEVAGMWKNIQKKSKPDRRLVIIKRITYSAVAVAASFALFLVARMFLDSSENHLPNRGDIMAFVDNNKDFHNYSEDIQLILSEQKTVYLQEKESIITYDSASVNTDSEIISKNEIASYNQLMIPYGKKSVLTLNDGTKIWVNAGTKLVYPVEFAANKREI